jgi:hypothetical protein
MTIEHRADRNNKQAQGATTMHDITDIQEAAVAGHIAALRHEAAETRARREQDHVRDHATSGTDADHPIDLPSARVRLGRWLVAFGQALAGSSTAAADDPCGDGRDRLAPAA